MRLTVILCLIVLAIPARAGDVFYEATITRVIDGDTLLVTVPGWPEVFTPARIRIYGIDTPESRFGARGARCPSERNLGKRAKAEVQALLPPGSHVRLQWMKKLDRYGRPLMRVFTREGANLGRQLLAEGTARSYRGGRKPDYCGLSLPGGPH